MYSILNKKSQTLIERLAKVAPSEIYLCSIVKAELFYGAHKSINPPKALKLQREFCSRFKSLSFDDKAANEYGKIRSYLEKKGKVIGPNDVIIASIAVANKITLITHNTKEFGRVKGLVIEDWQE